MGEPPAFFKDFSFLLACLWISVTPTDIFLSLLMTHVLMTGCLQTMLKTHRQVSRAFAFPASLKHPLKLKMGKMEAHTHQIPSALQVTHVALQQPNKPNTFPLLLGHHFYPPPFSVSRNEPLATAAASFPAMRPQALLSARLLQT